MTASLAEVIEDVGLPSGIQSSPWKWFGCRHLDCTPDVNLISLQEERQLGVRLQNLQARRSRNCLGTWWEKCDHHS